MQAQEKASDEVLGSAVAVAIAARKLPHAARGWGKTVILEELAPVMGMARNTLRNLYYRGDARFEEALLEYITGSQSHLLAGIGSLAFREFSPVVWKRTPKQLRASWCALPSALSLARAAERSLRQSNDPPIELRRAAGAVAAEIMACALTFFEGNRRRHLLETGERIFLLAMSPLAFRHQIGAEDAMLFARFWENRASRCGLEWSNVWDDPSAPPPVGMDLVELAVAELDQAADWTRRHGGAEAPSEAERLRQLLADKAKWLAKAGHFPAAHQAMERLPVTATPTALADVLLLRTLEAIAANRLQEAESSGGVLRELVAEGEEDGSVAVATSEIMIHNIALLRGRRPEVPEQAQYFLQHSPVVASELVNLPNYKKRLEAAGYLQPWAPTTGAAV